MSKKLCLPLPNLISKGRLYKARSCGSIAKDRIVSSLSAGTSDSKTGVNAISRPNGPSGVLYYDRCKSPNILMNQSLDSIDTDGKCGDLEMLVKKSPIKIKGDAADIYDISPEKKNNSNKVREGGKCPIVGLCQMHMKDAAKCHLS